ncbi:MAG: GNAT family N-acetyltransferase [Verrucomicrobiae bacterium]|nr:GNAT family N-acetyltransferase [Verrucomicrobiae bacterium]
MKPGVSIRRITARETVPVRHVILRPGRPVSDCVFAHDEDSETAHFGAFVDGVLVGVASVYRLPPPGTTDVSAWQVRGMAVLEHMQKQGIGSALLQVCCEYVKARGGRRLWCNARTEAVSFYAKHGFQTASAEFVIPGVGPHRRMERQLV